MAGVGKGIKDIVEVEIVEIVQCIREIGIGGGGDVALKWAENAEGLSISSRS